MLPSKNSLISQFSNAPRHQEVIRTDAENLRMQNRNSNSSQIKIIQKREKNVFNRKNLL